MATQFDARQTESVENLPRTVGAAGVALNVVLPALDSEITPPFAMSTSGSSLVLNIASVAPSNPTTGLNRTVPPIVGLIPAFTSGTITFPSSSGGNAVPSAGSNKTITISPSNYLKVGVSISTLGNIVMTLGTQATSIASATQPQISANSWYLGYVVLYNNAGTISNLTTSSIYQSYPHTDNVPLTAKGDLFTFDGTNYAALAVSPTSGYALVADSTQTTGLNWANVVTNPMTGVGDMIYGGTSGVPTRLAFPGGAGYVLDTSSTIPAWSQTPLSTGILTTNVSALNLTVPSGETLFQANLTVNTGATYTIAGNGELLNTVTVLGTVTVTGSGRTI